MKKAMILLTAMLTTASMAMADEVTVGQVTIPQGGTAKVSISLTNPGNIYTAGQMVLALPEGVTAVLKDNGDPTIEVGGRMASTNHSIGASHLSDGTEQFTIFSISSEAIVGSDGVLFSATVTADESLTIGTTLEGCLTDIEMTTTDGVRTLFNDQTFTITIGEPVDPRVTLDETSTTVPEAATGVDIRVKRTINAGEWSTICLPFAMTEAQVKEAFGEDVQLADFNDYEYDDAAGTISVKFANATAIDANHPYIIKVSKDVTEFTADGVTIDPQEAVVDFDTSRRKNQPRQMVDTYVANTVLDWGTLFLSGNQFWYSMGLTKMKAFRAYFNFYDLLADFEDNYESRQIRMVFADEATDIRDINSDAAGNSRYYDLQGRQIVKPAKGIYVNNGKLVINK